MTSIAAVLRGAVRRLWSCLAPLRARVEPLQVVADLRLRSRQELVVENATLRHQLSVLRRTSGRAQLGPSDRLRLLKGAAFLPAWRKAIVVGQPETILKWHRSGFRLFWRHRSKSRMAPRLAPDKIDLIRDMAERNRLWDPEKIRGELLKLGVRVSKCTIQRYMRDARSRTGGQTWATFLENHAHATWACDFIQAYDILFQQVYAFFIMHLGSRKVVYAAACMDPTQEWKAQQPRNATMDGKAPKILLRDRDDKFGASFDRVAEGVGIRAIKTAVRDPT
jgi:putative transposase